MVLVHFVAAMTAFVCNRIMALMAGSPVVNATVREARLITWCSSTERDFNFG